MADSRQGESDPFKKSTRVQRSPVGAGGMEPVEGLVERRRSVASVKRRRDADEDESILEEGDSRALLRAELEDYLFSETSKVSRSASSFILRKWRKLEELLCLSELKVAELSGRLIEREGMAPQAPVPSYADVSRQMPRVGRKPVVTRDPEKTVLLYPKDSTTTDSEITKRAVKEAVVPKDAGIQVRVFKKVQNGGVIIETATRQGAVKFKEITSKVPSIRVAEPRKILPKLLIYDVEQTMQESAFKEFLYSQNLADKGILREVVDRSVKLCFKTGRKDTPTCNWVVEVPPEVRSILLEEGRAYLDFAACKVVDHLAVPRCYKCQGYGHVERLCRRQGGPLCSHCGGEGHLRRECSKAAEKPLCLNCSAARRPCDHRVGTFECPMYRRLVEHRLSLTDYGQ